MTNTPTLRERRRARYVECSHCGATRGQRCLTAMGRELDPSQPHKDRVETARNFDWSLYRPMALVTPGGRGRR